VDDGSRDEGDGSGFGSEGGEGFLRIADESGFKEEVAGWVTAGGEFGSEDEFRARVDQFGIGVEQAGAVAGEVTDGWVNLYYSNFHALEEDSCSIEFVCLPTIANE
jgi:hypothetical protein